MSNEINDLNEFNAKVAQSTKPRCEETVNHVVRGFRQKAHKTDTLVDILTAIDDCESDIGSSKEPATTTNNQMWAVYGDRNFSACEKAVDILPPGQYIADASQELGIYFRKADANLDELVHLPDSVSEQIIDEIGTFWTKEEHFRSFGFLWKRGVLIWGAPGGGKTSCLQIISQRIVEQGGISIYVDNPGLTAKALAILRRVEPNRPLIIMIEDIDAVINEYGEHELLALMDGELQIDNVVFIATTNYPERLDKRFINRPSRFDVVKKIGMPGAEARAVYLKAKNSRLAGEENTDQLQQWVKVTEGFSIAHMKELIVSVEVFEVPLDVAAKRLKTMMDCRASSSDNDGRSFGFGQD